MTLSSPLDRNPKLPQCAVAAALVGGLLRFPQVPTRFVVLSSIQGQVYRSGLKVHMFEAIRKPKL